MTEEEARKKWCPFARVIHYHDNDDSGTAPASGNRGCHGDPKPEANCIASDCMAWRPTIVGIEHGDPVELKTQGYCGLAK